MMTPTERNAIIQLLEDALDKEASKIAIENYNSAESLINRALYWLNGTDEDDMGEDGWDELDFEQGAVTGDKPLPTMGRT